MTWSQYPDQQPQPGQFQGNGPYPQQSPYPEQGGFPGHNQQPPGGFSPQGEGKNRRRAGNSMIKVGIAFIVVGLLAGFGLAWFASSTFDTDDSELIYVESSAEVELEGGQDWNVLRPESENADRCQVLGPDGSAAPIGGNVSQSRPLDGQQWESVQSFATPTGGMYSINCDGPAYLAPTNFATGLIATIGSGLIMVFTLGVGALLVILGLVRRSRDKKAQPDQGPQGGWQGHAPGEYSMGFRSPGASDRWGP